MQQPSLPSLPPVSSIFPRHEYITYSAESEQRRHGYTQQPHPSHLGRPLQYSERYPAAPPHHVYHAPQPSQAMDYRSQPTMAPGLPGPAAYQSNHNMTPSQYAPPSTQTRQSKPISQRRDGFLKEYSVVNRPPRPVHIQARDDQPPPQNHSYEQDRSQYSPQSAVWPLSSSILSPQAMSRPRNGSIPVSNLLREPAIATSQVKSPPKYGLIVRQQPESARACGFGERDRRVVDPPPILVLDIDEPHDRAETYVVHCTLWNPEMDEDDSAMPINLERRQQRRLMGTNIASPFYGKDENNVDKCFFTFPDLSVRTPGAYSLRFMLVVLDCRMMCTHGYKAPVVATVNSNPFNVFNAKDFRGMRASTTLTKALKAQGCLIPVKKGNSRTKTNDDYDYGNGLEMDDNDDNDDNEQPRVVKRARR
ncbi:velvet factor-domain-containing protein [Calycina marina]|uniref:Velvet factor-domain-containing protein n=1 Tax=Calycina marina TaxID=1763456 RepID=A0A9P8CCC4_9HELO|nr:velvet factor-domain-containing protein [Calycina marina]